MMLSGLVVTSDRQLSTAQLNNKLFRLVLLIVLRHATSYKTSRAKYRETASLRVWLLGQLLDDRTHDTATCAKTFTLDVNEGSSSIRS